MYRTNIALFLWSRPVPTPHAVARFSESASFLGKGVFITHTRFLAGENHIVVGLMKHAVEIGPFKAPTFFL